MTEIVRFGVEDVQTLLEIENSCFTHPWSIEAFKAAATLPNYLPLCAKENGVITGFAVFLESDVLEVMNIAVRKEFRKKGTGSLLLKSGLDAADKDAFLEVRRSNAAARAMYEKFGFKEISVRRGYYSNPTDDAIIMKREKSV